MPRGGSRKGAGRKSSWNNKETTVIRVPKVFADRLLEIAQKLDKGEVLDLNTKSKQNRSNKATKTSKKIDSVTESKLNQNEFVIDSKSGLSGVRLAKRLGSSETSVRRHRDGKRQPSLWEWSRERDPDGIAWEYRSDQKYYPCK